MRERVVAACDGASKGNPGPAGWAWVVSDGDERTPRPLGGGPARPGHQQRRRTDGPWSGCSRPSTRTCRWRSGWTPSTPMKAVTTWLPGWKRNGWKTAAGKPVANQGSRGPHRRTPRRPVRRVPLRARPPGRRRPAERLPPTVRPARRPPSRSRPAASSAPGTAAVADTPATAGAPRRKATRRTGGAASARTIKAKFPGRCLCGRSYAAGEKIAKNAQGWGHPECRTAEA